MSWRIRRRVPFVAQMEATECGAASLAMVLAFHGCHVPLAELRDACSVSRDGTSAFDLASAGEGYGLDVEASKLELDELDEVVVPAILHWELNHFVVLERLHGGGAELVDPAVGRRVVSRDELARSFTGVVLELEPGARFEKRVRTGRSKATYARLLERLAVPLTVTIASSFLLEIFGLLVPAGTALVVDFVVRPRQERWIAILALAFAFAVALRAALSVARDRILAGMEARLDVELASALVKHLLTLPLSFFSQRGAGDLLSRVSALLGARDVFARLAVAGFDTVLLAAYGALMVLYDVRLGGLLVALQVAMVVAMLLGRGRVRSAMTSRLLAGSRVQAALVQAFVDPETAKAFHAEDLLASRYAAARSKELNAQVAAEAALVPLRHAQAVLETTGTTLVLWLGGKAVLADRMTVGVLASFLALQTLSRGPLERIVASLRDLGDIGPLLDRVDDVFDTKPEPGGTFVPSDIEGALTFENVSFRYGRKGPWLLDGVSFHVDAGERIAIAGASGAGKSTILRLVLGLIQPTSGRILLDGRDLREYDLDALRSAMGTVLSGGAFFDESVFENVALGAPEVTAERVRGALEAACVADVVDALPGGVLSRLGRGAPRLSGGQRQRLLLTRALAKSPAMLLLDEASSALDGELEARVQGFLSTMRCTSIIIAHRLSAIRFADRVLFLRGGKIVQDGLFEVLTRQPGPLLDMVRTTTQEVA